MRVRVRPGGRVGGEARVPGDKSIAHRWLILAATGRGASVLRDLPVSLDVLSTAECLARVAPVARRALEAWASRPSGSGESHGFTWDRSPGGDDGAELRVEGEGREALRRPAAELDCGNSGTTIRLLAGVLAARPFRTVLTGDPSLRTRPMDRVAAPLREMGAVVRTADGHPPLEIDGGQLHGIRHAIPTPSAQVKGAVLLAGLSADGETLVEEAAATRDHTERALAHLGAPVRVEPGRVSISAFQHAGFEARLAGDVSSAAFLAVGAALTRGELVIRGVGLNPTRSGFLGVMRRMGVETEVTTTGIELGEPVGDLHVVPSSGLVGTTVEPEELPLVIDEVPVLAALAAHAEGETTFAGAGELRVKESDRLEAIAAAVRGLHGQAEVEGDNLVIAGGGLEGGIAEARGDHRVAMAAVVAALAARGDCTIEGIEAADVSFPGFAEALLALGAELEV